MNARLGFAAAVGLSCLVVPPAMAEPVSTGRVAAVAFELAGAEGDVVRLDVRVLDRDDDVVTVAKTSCTADGCTPAVHYEAVLESAAELDPDVARGSARLAVGGHLLVLHWQPDDRGAAVVVGGLQAAGTETTHTASTYTGDPAVSEVTWAGQTCATGDAAVGTGVRAEVSGGSDSEHAARPLAALRLPAGQLRCTPVDQGRGATKV